MTYTYEEYQNMISKIVLLATLYNIELYVIGKELTQADIYSVENSLKRYRKQYPYCSYLIAESVIDSEQYNTYYEKTGKKGRPPKKFEGKKAPRHLHIIVIGDELHSAYTYGNKVVEAINKRFSKRFNTKVSSLKCKGHDIKGAYFINYCLDQAQHYRTGGSFDFMENTSPLTP